MDFYLQQSKLIKLLGKDRLPDKVRHSLTKMEFSPSDIELILSDQAEKARQLYWARLSVDEYNRVHRSSHGQLVGRRTNHYRKLGLEKMIIKNAFPLGLIDQLNKEDPSVIKDLSGWFKLRRPKGTVFTFEKLFEFFYQQRYSRNSRCSLDPMSKLVEAIKLREPAEILKRLCGACKSPGQEDMYRLMIAFLFAGDRTSAKSYHDKIVAAGRVFSKYDIEEVMQEVIASYNLENVKYAAELLGLKDFHRYPRWIESYGKKVVPIVDWLDSKIENPDSATSLPDDIKTENPDSAASSSVVTKPKTPDYMAFLNIVTSGEHRSRRHLFKWLVARIRRDGDFNYLEVVKTLIAHERGVRNSYVMHIEPQLTWIYKQVKKSGQIPDYNPWFLGLFGGSLKTKGFEVAVQNLEVLASGTLPINYHALALAAIENHFLEGFRFLIEKRFYLLNVRHNYAAYLTHVHWFDYPMIMSLIEVLRPYPVNYPEIIRTQDFHQRCGLTMSIDNYQQLKKVFEAMIQECIRRRQEVPYQVIQEKMNGM